jgi:hypothetical protein
MAQVKRVLNVGGHDKRIALPDAAAKAQFGLPDG